eukprot:3028149-Ditylum_brightwellii.AAC.2
MRKFVQQNDTGKAASPFLLEELTPVISYLPAKKAIGKDGIYNEQLIHASSKLRTKFLLLINLIWETGEFP